MRYIVTINGERYDVDVDAGVVRIDTLEVAASIADVDGTPIVLARIGTEVHRVVVKARRGRGAYSLWLDGHRFEVEALNERARAIKDLSAAVAAPSGPAPLIAPMPGLIVRVHVAPGDTVALGQGLVVMEAMKMENELRSPAAGRVRAVLVAAGTAVEKGAVLIEME
jgi:biotin carboxyl carrier protein